MILLVWCKGAIIAEISKLTRILKIKFDKIKGLKKGERMKEYYKVPNDETIIALKNSKSVGVFKDFGEFESGGLSSEDADDLREKYQKLLAGEMELCSFDEVDAYLDELLEK